VEKIGSCKKSSINIRLINVLGGTTHEIGKNTSVRTTALLSVALVRERTIQTERPPPVGEVNANFLRIEGCHVVSATDPHGR